MPNSIAIAVRDKRGIWSRRVSVDLYPGDTLATLAARAMTSKRVSTLGAPRVDILMDNDGYYSPQFVFSDGTYLRALSVGSALAADRMIRPPWWRVSMRRVFWWLCLACVLTWAWYLIQLWR